MLVVYSMLILVGTVFTIIIVSMILLYLTIRKQEQRTARWSQKASERRAQKMVVIQEQELQPFKCSQVRRQRTGEPVVPQIHVFQAIQAHIRGNDTAHSIVMKI